MDSIEIEDLKKILSKEKINIIDIRPINSIVDGKIPFAKNISPTLLVHNPNAYININEKYYIYCQSGTQSKLVVELLNSKGYQTVNINGGYNNYLLRK